MTAWSGRVPTLASMLRANDEAVSADWAWLVHNMPGSSYGGQPLDDLRASTSRGLRAIIEALHTGFGFLSEGNQPYAPQHGLRDRRGHRGSPAV